VISDADPREGEGPITTCSSLSTAERNAPMATTSPSIEQRIAEMAGHIHRAIPDSEVRLFGSRARGTAGPDSDIDLLITAPDDWIEGHHGFHVLEDLWGQLAQADVSLDLLLHSAVSVRNGAIDSAMSSAAPTGHFHIQVR